MLGTTKSANGYHSKSPKATWHAHVHSPRRPATSVGATDQRHSCEGSLLTRAQPTSEGAFSKHHAVSHVSLSCGLLERFAHHACYNLAAPETSWLRIMPLNQAESGSLTTRVPSPHSAFAVCSPFHFNQSWLGVTAESREGTSYEDLNGCKLAEQKTEGNSPLNRTERWRRLGGISSDGNSSRHSPHMPTL